MKKRVTAIVCALATLLCVCAAAVTTRVSAATKTFEVGYARVDINPWADPYDLNKDGSKGGILQLPLRGNGNTMNRQSVPELIDDNGDGQVKNDGSDGLFAACIAVTDDDGDTVLMYSVAIIGGFDRMVDDTRSGLLAALREKGIDVKLSAQDIQIQGTHTHNSIDLTMYTDSNKGSTKEYKLQDQNGDPTEETITAGEVYDNFTVWYPYLIDQMVSAGVAAIEDRATATMSKGEIDAGDASGKVMNTVRHYTRVSSSTGEVIVRGSNFNGNVSYNPNGDGSVTGSALVEGSAELAKANDTMYCLKFSFSNGNAPIALVNWRAHTTQNDRDGTRLNVSSCYVNRMSYELSKKDNGGYRSIFIQGAAGNVNPTSALYGGWCGSTTHTYRYTVAGNGAISYTGELSGNIYGKVLGQVAANCLKNKMTVVSAGDIRVTNMVFNSVAKTYKGNTIASQAAETVYSYGSQSVSYPFIYPIKVTEKIYNTLSETQKSWYNSYTGSSTYKALSASTYKGPTYALASRFHVSDIRANDNETGKQNLDMTAFMLGDSVAFITAPGEMYDRYNSDLTWEQLKDKTQKEIYDILSATNEWDKLLSKNVGGSYGTPFVMGYANRHIGYLPNKIAYEYCKGSKIAAIGAYESHNAEMAQGECEKMMDIYAGMLGSLVSDQLPQGGLYRTAYCQACKTTVNWKPMCDIYNNHSGTPGLPGGHYYLSSDMSGAQKNVMDGNTLCLDLNGHTFTGQTRAFILNSGKDTLNIMDSSEAKNGKLQGHGSSNKAGKSPFGGGTIFVGKGDTCNLYSGTLTQAFTNTSGVANGGVVEVRYEGSVFNMYGGTITGGKAHWTGLSDGTSAVSLYGGNVYVYGGTFNMYDGTISGGVAQAHVVDTLDADGKVTATKRNTAYGGNVFVRAEKYTAADGSTYYAGNFNMYGGTITGGRSISYTSSASRITANSYGGNIGVGANANLNLYGGTVTDSSAGYKGNCVYLSESGYTTLSGDADVNELCFGGNSAEIFTISGVYTGTTSLRLPSTVAAQVGTVVGISNGADISNADISVAGSELTVEASGKKLVLAELSGAQFEDANGNKVEKSLQTAIAACQGTDKVVTLTQDAEVTGITVTKELLLDLNGKQVTGQFAISGKGKLICMDSQTADYKADDGKFTKLPASMAANAVAAEGYVKYTHDNGAVSFHKIATNAENIYFRPQAAGLFYGSLFMGDVYAAQEVESFGVALSIKGSPIAGNGIAEHAQYSSFDGSLFEPGNQSEFASTILTDVLSEKYGSFQNKKNGETVVYGCSYIKLKNGDYVFSDVAGVTLKAVIEYVNDNWNAYAASHEKIFDLYERFPAVINTWETDVIAQKYEENR